MLIVFRNSLIVVLALLQLFAPLVHAHSGSNTFNKGLHLPGLEAFSTHYDAPVIQNVKLDNDNEGLLVVVDAGIKNPQDSIVESDNHAFVLLPTVPLQVISLPFTDHNFSPHDRPFSFLRYFSSLPSRAPPAQ